MAGDPTSSEQGQVTTKSASGGSGFSLWKLFVVLLGIALVLGVVYFLFVDGLTQKLAVIEESIEDVDDGLVEDFEDKSSNDSYLMDEVAIHSYSEDCWIIIDGGVYDVSFFITDLAHPGGNVILEGCGTDATELFNTRLMGSSTPHSSNARTFLKGFYIGEFENELEEIDDGDHTIDEVSM